MSAFLKKLQSDFSFLIRNHHFVDNISVALISLVTRFRGFILLPLITKSLGILDYGIWVQCIAISSLLSTFQGFNLHTYLVRSIPEQEELAGELYTSTLILFLFPNLLIAALMLLIFYLFDPGQILLQLPEVSQLLFMAVMMAPFIALFQLNMNYYRARLRIKFQLICNALATTAELIGIIYFIAMDGLLGALYFMFAWWILVSLFSTIVIVFTTPRACPRIDGVVKAYKFSWPLLFSNISALIINRSDKILIGSIFGAAVLGIYSIAANLGAMISIVLSPFSITLLPKMSNLWKNSQQQAELLVDQYRNVFLVLAIPLLVLIGTSGDHLIAIFSLEEASTKFTHGIFLLVSMGNLLWGLCVFETFLLYGEGRTGRVASIRFQVAMFNLLGNIVVLHLFGYFFASIVFFLSYMLMYLMHRHANGRATIFDHKQLISCIGISMLLAFLLNYVEHFLESGIAFLLVFVSSYILVLVIIYFSQVIYSEIKADY